MNLFGNALKYTKRGFVNITLKTQPSSTSKPSAAHIVTLQVEDSGKGMSENYLKYNVFTPFVQEDQMAVGTGLGLSIVRHLVRDLGGQIDIQSEIRHGTTVTVSVPLHSPSAPTEGSSISSETLLRDVKSRTKGLRLCLVDFDYYPDGMYSSLDPPVSTSYNLVHQVSGSCCNLMQIAWLIFLSDRGTYRDLECTCKIYARREAIANIHGY